MQFALLGDVQFELITYFDGLEGRFASDYAEHALIEGKPRLQWIGERLDEWTLKLKFHQLFCDPELELARLRDAMETHDPLPFVLASRHPASRGCAGTSAAVSPACKAAASRYAAWERSGNRHLLGSGSARVSPW